MAASLYLRRMEVELEKRTVTEARMIVESTLSNFVVLSLSF